jgi:hypothetical protein
MQIANSTKAFLKVSFLRFKKTYSQNGLTNKYSQFKQYVQEARGGNISFLKNILSFGKWQKSMGLLYDPVGIYKRIFHSEYKIPMKDDKQHTAHIYDADA